MRFAVFLLICAIFVFEPPIARAMPQQIVVVSIDALHPDAVTPAAAPLLYGLAEEGAANFDARSVTPPRTLVAHTAMITGLAPEDGGRTDNSWSPGEPRVQGETLFHAAKALGFRTGFFYAKERLGHLISPAVDESELTAFPEQEALNFLQADKAFAFVHLSGLDQAGPSFGWLSPEYMEELGFIDEYLRPLVAHLRKTGSYLLIVLADHAGHDKQHGTTHPEDFKIPLIVVSDTCNVESGVTNTFRVDQLPALIHDLLALCESKNDAVQ